MSRELCYNQLSLCAPLEEALQVKIRIGNVLDRSRANGPGERFVIWVQGCSLRCPGCFNPELHDPDAGEELTTERLAGRIQAAQGLRGLTISGGEPMEQAEAVLDLLERLPGSLDVVIFSGYALGEIKEDPGKARVLRKTDLLVAGRFRQDLASEKDPWTGSSNQTVHALTGRIRPHEHPECRVEVRVAPGGKTTITGFPPEDLKKVR